MESNKPERKFTSLICFVIPLAVILIVTGCGKVGKMISAAAQFSREVTQLESMELSDIKALVSKDIDFIRLKDDPDGVLGQYVQLKGHVNINGTENFPLEMKNQHDSTAFILEDTAFVITIREYPTLRQDDVVEIVGVVSKSRLIKQTAEMYPDQKIPDYVTIIAKEVEIITPESSVAPETIVDNMKSTEESQNAEPEETKKTESHDKTDNVSSE
ncbi:MAG: hypothetical protein ABIG42_06985 [bacterium]